MKNRQKLLFSIIGSTVFALGALVLPLTACGNGQSDTEKENQSGLSNVYDGTGAEYIVNHTEGQKVQYTFEAENTNLTNKSGPSFSGGYTDKQMVIYASGVDASNDYVVGGMGAKGVSLNFVIVSDRDVEDAVLTLRVGTENLMTCSVSADDFLIRIDPVFDDDLVDYRGEENGGAWNSWDQFFLGYYYDSRTPVAENEFATAPFAGYYVDEYFCGEISVTATSYNPSGFEDFVVFKNLSLQKGVNSISLITNNNIVPEGADNATFTATAPLVDCIKITTIAQLGLYSPQDNGYGTADACTYKTV